MRNDFDGMQLSSQRN